MALRRLEAAYQAAMLIQQIEVTRFGGGMIVLDPKQGKIASDYFCTQRDRELARIRWNLAQFRLSQLFINQQAIRQDEGGIQPGAMASPERRAEFARVGHLPLPTSASEIAILEKLALIEGIVAKYRHPVDREVALPTGDAKQPLSNLPQVDPNALNRANLQTSSPPTISDPVVVAANRQRSRSRLVFGGLAQVGQELTPEYEQQVIQELRLRRQQQRTTIQWITILVLIPLLVHITAKTLVFDPLLGNFSDKHPQKIEIREEIQERFFQEYNLFKESLEIKQILGVMPKLTEAETEAKLYDKLIELWRESREAALDGLKNLLADLTALLSFIGLVYFNRNQLAAVRSYSNWAFLSLTDPTKVFIFIFLTDMFVGFHSAEGWEVILTGVFEHFGLPENRALIGMFIATVPVFIDSCIKFWIFNYFTRFSPSASAIFERMNA
ncbi:hypothetical protein ACN4EK_10095 [Pantanalinema rosaneae CENA516]|uniref:hypothetical protein n=1 Tax=Pantanalinema rosaneae TaxID=1620701 RepID=UPI003D6E318B